MGATRVKYRLLVVDIDGTLVDKTGTVSPRNREALRRAREGGVHISLCTGRVTNACRKIIRQLPLHGYHIYADGAIVCNPEPWHEVYVRRIDAETVRRAVEFSAAHDIELELYSATRYFARRETWSTGAHQEFFGIEPNIRDFDGIWEEERIIKAGMAVTNPEEAAKAKTLGKEFEGCLDITWAWTPAYPDAHFLNIVAPEVSKGKALEALTEHLGVSLSETIAVGDGNNDLSLLTTAGFSVAMANAPDRVKSAADHVTGDVEHDGLAEAVERFVL